MSPQAVRELVVLIIAAVIFAAGFVVGTWRKDAEIERIKGDQEKAVAKAVAVEAGQLAKADQRNGELVAQLAAAENLRAKSNEEKDLAIRHLTTGRRCLDRAVVRVLNDEPAAQPAVPTPGAEPVSADAAFATDTDVGLWARTCKSQYEKCNASLGAINRFYKDLPSD